VAVSQALRKLLRIRNLEEEQSRTALEAGMAELRALEAVLVDTVVRDRRGRRLVEASAETGELPDRLAGLEEQHAAGRWQRGLAPRIQNAEQDVASLREEYLARRVERRQAETLVEKSVARAAAEVDRRSQQGLDDWFRNRLHRDELEAKLGRSGDARRARSGMESKE
jgi:flagellar biosynthesis chaperone FliJ